MTPPRKIAAAFAAAAGTLVLALPGVASANAGQQTFEQTYPIASKLCARVAKGGGSPALRANAPTVLADCTTLLNNFNAARASVITTEATLRAEALADRATRKALCSDKAHPVRCALALRRSGILHRHLGKLKLEAARTYWRTVEADRRAFWAEIHVLRGGKNLPADKPIPEQNS